MTDGGLTDTELFRALMGLLLLGLGGMLARIWLNIDKLFKLLSEHHKENQDKLDAFTKAQHECQLDLPRTYLDKESFTEWRNEWKEFLKQRRKEWQLYWMAFNTHKHDSNSGNVVRRNGGQLPTDEDIVG